VGMSVLIEKRKVRKRSGGGQSLLQRIIVFVL